ncbi:MAG: S9 family peptidase [Vicinamibacteria bacterium]
MPAEPPRPPIAKTIPKVEEVHGDRRVDEYAWLREKSSPEVRAHLEAENAYSAAVLEPLGPLRAALYDEMLGRIKQTDVDVPWRQGDWFYYSRTEKGRQYPIHCRRPNSPEAPERITLDLNEMAREETFMALGAYEVSDDGRLLAYSTDTTGFRQYTLFVKDLESGEIRETVAERVGSAAWAADNRTLFYTIEEESTKRQYRLYRHVVGEAAHELVYEETDLAFNVGVDRTRSREYLILDIDSLTTSEARFLPAHRPTDSWRLLAPRIPDQELEIDHRGDEFYLRVNDAGRNFRLVRAPVANPGRESWQEVLPHRADVMLEGFDLFRNHCVVFEREGGLPHVRITDLRTAEWHRIAFPEPTYSAYPEDNAEFDSTVYRYGYESLVTPPSVFDYDMEARTSTRLKQEEILGGYDPTEYETERVWATAADGETVPISLVRRRDVATDGRAPLYVYAYGSYGIPLPATFSSNRLSLLDRGVVVALAHIRGGGDLGKRWHDAGRMLSKRNTFTDFIACAEHLLAEGYGARERLVIEGASAGGLLMGAVTNMRPDLFRAVLLEVPFVDVINTMLDETLPLTVGEFEEWGNPRDKTAYEYIRSYCPYINLKRADYPAMLVRTSLNDSQVMYWEPAKYVARLRTLKTDARPLLLETNMAAGHGGASGRYDRLREIAFDYAFILWQMGLMSADGPAVP